MDFTHLYSIINEQATPVSDYYNSLNSHLDQFNMSLGENMWNKTGVIDKNQKGIYFAGDQIGKIERIIEPGTLYMDHISAKVEGNGLVKKIYPHDKQYADKNDLVVISDLVNDYTYSMFINSFKDWNITSFSHGDQENMLKAVKIK